VARYGEFVLLKPRFERQTWLLWLLTPLVLVGGGLALWLQMRRRPQGGGDMLAALTPEEEAKLAALMSDDAEKPG